MRADENSITSHKTHSQMNLLELMQFFYELFPYPNRPIFLKPDPRGSIETHAGYSLIVAENCSKPTSSQRRDLQLRDVRQAFAANKRIALIGCGTDEPLLFRTLHPQNPITAIDLSRKSLLKAERKIRWHGLKPIEFVHGDANFALKKDDLFDHIQCFGVLHHQPQPQKMLARMAESLVPGGTLRLMIYSCNSRRLERGIQKKYRSLWQNNLTTASSLSERSAWQLRLTSLKLLCWRLFLPFFSAGKSNRFGYIGISAARVADALLHPSDHPLSLNQVLTWSSTYGLRLVAFQAKSYELGRLNSHSCPKTSVQTLVDEEERGNISSNIVLVFQKVSSV